MRSSGTSIRSVRQSDQADRTPLRLAIGVIATIGGLGCLWLMGYLGFRLGYAPLVRIPDLMCSSGDALANAVQMLVAVPRTIFHSGLSHPMWLMLGFLLVAVPSAALGAIKPLTPGGPRPKPEMVISSHTGAVAALLNSVLLLIWAGSSFRNSHIREMPFDLMAVEKWLADLQAISGLDVLAVMTGTLWIVVIMRLSIPAWLRGMSAVACFSALAVVVVAMSVSNVSSALLQQNRAMSFLNDGSVQPRLIIGSTHQYLATLHGRNNSAIVELRNYPATLEVVGKLSIVDFLIQEAQSP